MAAEVQPIKTNFTAGEISPRLMGRIDVNRYFNGARILENFIVMPHGGCIARPGTRFVCEVKDNTKAVKLIPFEFSEDESYVLEFGDSYIRFFSNDGQVVNSTQNITNITQAATAVVTCAGHGYTNGQHVWLRSVGGMTEVNGRRFTVANATANTFELSGENSTSYGAYTSGGTVASVYEISSPYGPNEIFELQVAQSADVMYIVHRNITPRKLTRTAHTNWTLSAPAFTSITFAAVGDRPGAVAFHEERLWFGGTDNETQTAWASKSGSYEDFTIGANPDDALKYTISTDQVNSIRWMSAGKILTIGTIGAEFNVSSDDNNAAITPDNVKISRETTYGSATFRPIRLGNSVLFVQRAKRKFREFAYNFEQDGYLGSDLTILSEHILREGVKDLAYQQEPDGNIWFARQDGQLVALTYQKDQQVFGWSRSILGGTSAIVESVAVIPDETQDQLWLSVKRTINGSTKRYIEYMTPPFYGTTEAEKKLAVQVDSSLTYNGTPVDTVSGLNHLIGQEIAILADGKVKPRQTVPATGKITINEECGIITIGVPFTPKVRTVNFEPGNPLGTAQGKTARISHVSFRFYQTLGGWFGYGTADDDGDMQELTFDDDGVTMDQSPAIYSGDKRAPFPKGYTTSPWVQYEQRDPLPACILAVMPEYRVNP